jgi:hypothetical protein
VRAGASYQLVKITWNRETYGGNVSSNVLSGNDWHLDLEHDFRIQSLQGDRSIDDPVNDTGLGPRCGDLHLSGEFAC